MKLKYIFCKNIENGDILNFAPNKAYYDQSGLIGKNIIKDKSVAFTVKKLTEIRYVTFDFDQKSCSFFNVLTSIL